MASTHGYQFTVKNVASLVNAGAAEWIVSKSCLRKLYPWGKPHLMLRQFEGIQHTSG